MPKFGFLAWDWKEQIPVEDLNNILEDINGPVRCKEVETGTDSYSLAVFESKPGMALLGNDEWEYLMNIGFMSDYVEFPDKGNSRFVYEATIEEIKQYIRDVVAFHKQQDGSEEREAAEREEARERKEFERLKAKFEHQPK